MNEIDQLREKCDALEQQNRLLLMANSSDRLGSVKEHLARVAVRNARVASYTAVSIRDRFIAEFYNDSDEEARDFIRRVASEYEQVAQQRTAEFNAQHEQGGEEDSCKQ